MKSVRMIYLLVCPTEDYSAQQNVRKRALLGKAQLLALPEKS
jgi:hypothetical protein